MLCIFFFFIMTELSFSKWTCLHEVNTKLKVLVLLGYLIQRNTWKRHQGRLLWIKNFTSDSWRRILGGWLHTHEKFLIKVRGVQKAWRLDYNFIGQMSNLTHEVRLLKSMSWRKTRHALICFHFSFPHVTILLKDSWFEYGLVVRIHGVVRIT